MLQSNRISLRPVKKEDLAYLNKWKNDFEIFKNLGGGFQPVSIDQQSLWMDNLIDMNGNSQRFIISVDENKPIGVVGLYNINYKNRNCEFGIYIGEKDFHGKGYGKEATKLMLNYGFANLNLNKIKLLVNEDNNAQKLYNNLGFRTIGYYEKERFVNNQYLDVFIMELLKKNFKEEV